MDVEVIDVQRDINGVAQRVKIRMGNVEISWELGEDKKLQEIFRSKPGYRFCGRDQLEISLGLYKQGTKKAYAILRSFAQRLRV